MGNCNKKIRSLSFAKNVLISFSLLAFLTASCGPSGVKAPKRKSGVNGADAITRSGQSLLEMDPEKMTDSELQNFLLQLQSRNYAETDEFFFLQQMNKELCDRLQRVRSECVASVRLIPDGSEKILGCSGNFSENSSINHKFEVSVASGGPYEIVANKNIKSGSFDSGASQVTFKSGGDASIRAPRFMDLTSLRLKAISGSLPAIGSAGFEFIVDEEVLFTNENLVPAEEGGGNYYRIDPAHLFEIKKSSSCRVELSEIQDIRQSILDRGAKKGATGQASTEQNDPKSDDTTTEQK